MSITNQLQHVITFSIPCFDGGSRLCVVRPAALRCPSACFMLRRFTGWLRSAHHKPHFTCCSNPNTELSKVWASFETFVEIGKCLTKHKASHGCLQTGKWTSRSVGLLTDNERIWKERSSVTYW